MTSSGPTTRSSHRALSTDSAVVGGVVEVAQPLKLALFHDHRPVRRKTRSSIPVMSRAVTIKSRPSGAIATTTNR